MASFRLIGYVYDFGANSLQMDFSAYYTAGQSYLADVSPYHNQYESNPDIWDGWCKWKHSRYLYPPILAAAFSVVARIPYSIAKFIWMGLTLVSVFVSLALFCRLAGLQLTGASGLVIVLAVSLFYPLLPLLERGQIDGLTFVFISAGLYLIVTKKWFIVAGLLLAAATMMKLHVVYLIPFVIYRKQYRVVTGYAAGLVLVLALSFGFFGEKQVIDYIFVELPRISLYGESGTGNMLLPESLRQSQVGPNGMTSKDGSTYHVARLEFVANATLVQTQLGKWVSSAANKVGIPGTSTVVRLLCMRWDSC